MNWIERAYLLSQTLGREDASILMELPAMPGAGAVKAMVGADHVTFTFLP